MSNVVFDGGALGCDCCGRVFEFDRRNLKIFWTLCKTCRLTERQQKPWVPRELLPPRMPGQAFARRPRGDCLLGPHGTVTKDLNDFTGYHLLNELKESDPIPIMELTETESDNFSDV